MLQQYLQTSYLYHRKGRYCVEIHWLGKGSLPQLSLSSHSTQIFLWTEVKLLIKAFTYFSQSVGSRCYDKPKTISSFALKIWESLRITLTSILRASSVRRTHQWTQLGRLEARGYFRIQSHGVSARKRRDTEKKIPILHSHLWNKGETDQS